MLFKDFLIQSHSEREYDKKEVEDSKLEELLNYAENLPEAGYRGKVQFILFKDGPDVYEKLNGAGGYNGVMIKSPHYIGVKTNDNDYKTIIYSAYAAEALIKRAFEFGLGTCWISLQNVSDELISQLTKSPEEKMHYIIAIGYPDKTTDSLEPSYTYMPTGKSGMSSNPYDGVVAPKASTSGDRMSTLEIVYLEEWGNAIGFDELENTGFAEVFQLVRYAPSNMNRQPWRFIIKGGEILLGVLNPKQIENITDAGIVIFLLEGLINDMNIPVLWQYTDMKVSSCNDEEYAILGRFII